MGYSKIIQSGQQIEIYSYKKKLNVSRRQRNYQRNKRKAGVENKAKNGGRPTVKYRSIRSIQRAKKSFFRLVATNLSETETPIFATFTMRDNLTLEFGYHALKLFWQKIRKRYPEVRYIVVPEWQKRGVLHFHALIWNVDKDDVRKERTTRNFQRCWGRGYVDFLIARDNSLAIAGYMAKYLVKGLEDNRLANNRAYTCSRNVKRPATSGTNGAFDFLDIVLPDKRTIVKSKQYDTLWLGQCDYIKYNISSYDKD